MIRGTTQEFVFDIPYHPSELNSATITFWQPMNNGTLEKPLPIVKGLGHCRWTSSSKRLIVYLQPTETYRFSDTRKAYTQLRAMHRDGFEFASGKIAITVYPLYDSSLTEEDIFDPAPLPPPVDMDTVYVLDGGTINETENNIDVLDGGSIGG